MGSEHLKILLKSPWLSAKSFAKYFWGSKLIVIIFQKNLEISEKFFLGSFEEKSYKKLKFLKKIFFLNLWKLSETILKWYFLEWPCIDRFAMILSQRTDPMCPNSNFTHNKYNYGETRDLRPKYLSGQIILPQRLSSR